MALLRPDAMVGHWEFTLGAARVKELAHTLGFPFLGLNIRDTEWDEPAFPADDDDRARRRQDRGPRPVLSLYADRQSPLDDSQLVASASARTMLLPKSTKARAAGADLVVLLSHNGFDVDRKLAERVPEIDVVLTAHTHDALPTVVEVGKTLLVASGSHGKFVSRLDLDVRAGRVTAYRYKLIPVFADVITPDPAMAAKIAAIRAPHLAHLGKVMGRTDTLLYRRGNFNGTLDKVICDALMERRDAEIALSPGLRWGTALIPGQDDHPRGYLQRDRAHLSRRLPHHDERRADQGHPRGYRRQSVQCRSLLPARRRHGADRRHRLHDRRRPAGGASHLGPAADADRRTARGGEEYVVAGWASVNEGTEGPPIWDVVANHIAARGVVAPAASGPVRVTGE